MSTKRQKCLECERSLICAVTTKIYPVGASLYCEKHNRAFMCIKEDIARDVAETMGVNWVTVGAFCHQHAVGCPCVVCEVCSEWIEATRVDIERDQVHANFSVPIKYPIKKIGVRIRLDEED